LKVALITILVGSLLVITIAWLGYRSGVTGFQTGKSPIKTITAPADRAAKKDSVPTATAKSGDDFQAEVARQLSDLKDRLATAQLQGLLLEKELETKTTGKTGARQTELATAGRAKATDAQVQLKISIRKDLLSLEENIKKRYGGSLPDWVKDNRDWRYLDKELS
jgi:hypothetical protein